MKSFESIRAEAVKQKGGDEVLEADLKGSIVRTPEEIAALGDDRLLSEFSKRVFQSGFNWKVVEKKWPDFETAFEGFDVTRNVFMSDDDLDAHLKNTGIVRHAKKILSVRDNAIFLSDLAKEHGSAAAAIGHWPSDDYIGLLDVMKSRGSRLGGMTGQYTLRFIGKESFILSRDVTAALISAGVIDKPASSKGAMKAVQAAFNDWKEESGLSLTHISRVLAMSVG
ncbi:MAG: DNA-3-methyladenine glycosylase I [Pseudomonadota bacterium]